MALSWPRLVEDLRSFPGKSLALQGASAWIEASGAFLVISLEVGEVFGDGALQLSIHAGPLYCRIEPAGPIDEGAAEVVAEVSTAVAKSGGAQAARSAVLRLCTDLCVELSERQLEYLSRAGRADEAADVDMCAADGRGKDKLLVPPLPQPLARDQSRVTDGGASLFSFESPRPSDNEDEEMGDAAAVAGKGGPAAARFAAHLRQDGPKVEDVIVWDGIVDGLRKLQHPHIELTAAGVWDGHEGLAELVIHNPDKLGWDRLAVMVVVSAVRPTRIEVKGAQVLPMGLPDLVAQVNELQTMGTGPPALREAISQLCCAVLPAYGEEWERFVKKLGDSQFIGRQRARMWVEEGTDASSMLQREMMAVEAMSVQIELIGNQIVHLERRNLLNPSIEQELRHELNKLRRASAEVEAEKKAAAAAVQGAMLELTDTNCTGRSVAVTLTLDDSRPSQSLRGVQAAGGVQQIQQALANSGPWAHYAAYQFATMLQREQDLHKDFVCFYHSYSHAALLYEVHAEIARAVFGLAPDCAPMPRISLTTGAILKTVSALRGKGGHDHDPAFRALGLSSSCSVFASGSEAPPVTCFQGGYSCTDISPRTILENLLASCLGGEKKGKDGVPGAEGIAKSLIQIASRHNLPVSTYGATGEAQPNGGCNPALSGYMLQIFVHRSIAEDYAYPSQPMGVPIKEKLIDYLEKRAKADGQARILFHPPTFVDPAKARLFHYCARPLQSCMNAEVPSSRGALISELREALRPITSQAQAVAKRLGLSP